MRGLSCLTTITTFFLVSCVGLRPAPQRFEYRQIHMGVEARIVLHAPDSVRARAAAAAAYARIAELDASMSDYRDDSELNRLTTRPPRTWIPVSAPLFTVLEAGQHMARLSSGAFDVTAGPQVRLWREARRRGAAPTADARAAALEISGWRLLELDPRERAVRLLTPGMQLDLGGIAKGYAADEALRVLGEHGLPRALIEFGGDIAVGDPPPGRRAWEVRVGDAGGAPAVLQLSRAAVSTSGDGVQYVEIDGIRYSHVVDPRTGEALRDQFTATVVAPRAMISDAVATLAGVLGPVEAENFVARHLPGVRVFVRRVEPGSEDG